MDKSSTVHFSYTKLLYRIYTQMPCHHCVFQPTSFHHKFHTTRAKPSFCNQSALPAFYIFPVYHTRCKISFTYLQYSNKPPGILLIMTRHVWMLAQGYTKKNELTLVNFYICLTIEEYVRHPVSGISYGDSFLSVQGGLSDAH